MKSTPTNRDRLRVPGMRFLLLITTMFFVHFMSAQSNIREHVALHLSHSSLITGETLYFSANVISAETNKYSPLSELVYVELINSKGESVHQSKIRVKEGKGYGDIFITSLLSTGSYQLIAYTRWMRNFDEYYHHPIQIINPFEPYELPAPSKDLIVKFHPEGGRLIANKQNKMVISVADYLHKGLEIAGRIVDDEGTVITGFQSESCGLASVEFTPETGRKYQLIVEDISGNFQFFELPDTHRNGFSLKVVDRGSLVEMEVIGLSNEAATIRVLNGVKEVYKSNAVANSKVLVSVDELNPGASLVVAEVGGRRISERIIYIYPDIFPQKDENTPSFSTRSYVSMPIEVDPSRISISVRKSSDLGYPQFGVHESYLLYGVDDLSRFQDSYLYSQDQKTLMDMLMISSSWSLQPIGESSTVALLPDHRGEIISGRLQLPDSMTYDKQMVAYSVIGRDYQVKMASVDGKGNFSMIITSFEEDRMAYITSVDGYDAEWIYLESSFRKEVPALSFSRLYLDTVNLKQIVDRSIRNQIENAYYELKADSILNSPAYSEEFGQFEQLYVLDDFNRFPTLKDSFVEYIPTIAVRNRRGRLEFRVSPKYFLYKPELKSMAFLDGLPVPSDEILNFSPYRIESIGVINNRYFMGPAIVDGIISFRTKEGNLHGFQVGNQSRVLDYYGVSPDKQYTFPIHENSALGEANLSSRIPDFRDQLYWNPDVMTSGDVYNLQFFTSDSRGQFEVAIEGISMDGKPISIRKYFTVE